MTPRDALLVKPGAWSPSLIAPCRSRASQIPQPQALPHERAAADCTSRGAPGGPDLVLTLPPWCPQPPRPQTLFSPWFKGVTFSRPPRRPPFGVGGLNGLAPTAAGPQENHLSGLVMQGMVASGRPRTRKVSLLGLRFRGRRPWAQPNRMGKQGSGMGLGTRSWRPMLNPPTPEGFRRAGSC